MVRAWMRSATSLTRLAPAPWCVKSGTPPIDPPFWCVVCDRIHRMNIRAQAIATIKIDEPHVRVIEYRFAPGAETGRHQHGYDYVVVPLLDGNLLIEMPDGTSHVTELHAHQPYTRRAGVDHNVINSNGFDFSFIEIELLR
jgi:beta-alanine degradation protein BauB